MSDASQEQTVPIDRRHQPAAVTEAGIDFDAVIVGAGISGLYMLHRLRGLGFYARVYETGSDVGGTWYWNRYPGARCDVESMEYSFSFSDELQQEWHWTERYAGQPEILRYVNHVADRFDLRRDIQFDTRVTSAPLRRMRATAGVSRPIAASASRPASASWPSAASRPLRSRRSPASIPFRAAGITPATGRTRGSISPASASASSAPAPPASSRSRSSPGRPPTSTSSSAPPTSPSRPAMRPLDPDEERRVKASYADLRRAERESRAGYMVDRGERSALEATPEEREREFARRWERGGFGFTSAFNDILTNRAANDTAAEFVRDRIREIVHDPAVAELLSPKDHPIGTKRLPLDTDYYETYNRDNVDAGRHPLDADRGHHAGRPAHARRRVRWSTASSSPPASTP